MQSPSPRRGIKTEFCFFPLRARFGKAHTLSGQPTIVLDNEQYLRWLATIGDENRAPRRAAFLAPRYVGILKAVIIRSKAD